MRSGTPDHQVFHPVVHRDGGGRGTGDVEVDLSGRLRACRDLDWRLQGIALRGDQRAIIGKREIARAGKARLPAARQFDLSPSEIEEWADQGKAGMENALRAKPDDIREHYERQLRDLQEAYGEAMLELRARKKFQSLLGKDEP